MAENLAEIDRDRRTIPRRRRSRTPSRRSSAPGRTLDRVGTIYGIWSSTMNAPEFQAVEREMAPKLAAFADQITQNETLFRRIEAVYNSPREGEAHARAAAPRVALLHELRPRRREARRRPRRSGSRRSTSSSPASTRRSARTCSPTRPTTSLVLESEADLAGLPAVAARRGAAAAASAKGQTGKWVITNTRSSVEPFLTYSDRRDLREKVWRMFVNRGDNGDEHDNNAIITEILQLRAERAKLLGYPTHAHWRLENAMAKTPERAMELMEAVWKPAVARVQRRSRRHAGARRQEKARRSRSSRGTTATTPRRCARRSTTSTRTRSSRTCSSTSCARGCSGSRASCSASTSRRSRTCPSITPTCASGK